MENYLGLLLALFAAFAITNFIQAQEQQGFISLDCGLPANGRSPYNDTFSRLHFSSDATFIQSGKTGKIQSTLVSRFMKPYTTLRYFPDGIRNCYNLNVEKGSKYLIRATFIYGNYDGHDIKPVFDLYLGPNLWATIDLERAVNGTRQDMLHIPTSNSLQICLVKTGETTPLISALELRPMENVSYSTESDSLNLYNMYYLSKSGSQIRNLSRNNLSGSLPQAFQRKGLELSVEGNPRLCLSDPCKKPTKKKVVVTIVVSVASAATVIFVVVLFLVVRMKNLSIMEGNCKRSSNSILMQLYFLLLFSSKIE
ncbi:BnaC02g44390D [Brassica napus]|uniref:BnaC02g44390D protein n=1 Tax=Brassica napus TaxID=3708 RepID=A0A078IZM4_BRANA|nr:BnaC02g44390D [Brassica napus]